MSTENRKTLVAASPLSPQIALFGDALQFPIPKPSPTDYSARGMVHHQDGNVGKSELLTPPELIKALGQFDLDPCSPVNRPWQTALNHYTILEDGLLQRWFGRVWLNGSNR
jgi:hypothetical protein